jgi:hypothetical protein
VKAYGHRMFAPVQGLAVSQAAGIPLWAGAIVALTSIPTSAGCRWSPDIDLDNSKTWQSHAWRMIAGSTAQRHRRLLHWIGLPAMAEIPLLILTLTLAFPLILLPAWGLFNGWVSHLIADWMFGRRYAFEQRDAGIPLTPCQHHVGIWGTKHNWKSDGWTARLTAIIVCPLAMLALVAVGIR